MRWPSSAVKTDGDALRSSAGGEDRPDDWGASKPAAPRHPVTHVSSFRRALVTWFLREGRDLPWRRTADPYAILVSELMLQQTRIETVLKRRYFERWLERFPGVAALAEAAEDEVLKCWEGLGYYQRARNLQKTARDIVQRYGGIFPREYARIRALPGVGTYTAGAIAAFAYNEPAPMVDGNVARVLARLFDLREPVDGTGGRRQLEEWSAILVDPERAREFQSGLMELGQTHCARNPACGACPVAAFCQTRTPEELPVRRGKVRIQPVEEWVLWLRDGARICLEREGGSRRKGLWRLPALTGGAMVGRQEILRLRYAITKYQVTMHVVRATAQQRPEHASGTWFEEADLEKLALASPDRRAVEKLLRLEKEGDLCAGEA